jgi:hypothetical protein
MRSPTCALARLLPSTPASEDDLRAMRAAAWHKQGVLVLVLDTVTDSWERKFLEGVGNRLYGRRQPVVGGMRDGR